MGNINTKHKHFFNADKNKYIGHNFFYVLGRLLRQDRRVYKRINNKQRTKTKNIHIYSSMLSQKYKKHTSKGFREYNQHVSTLSSKRIKQIVIW